MSNSSNKLAIAKQKYIAIKRAERRLINRLNDIDWEHEVLKPGVEELEANATVGEIPQFIVDEDRN